MERVVEGNHGNDLKEGQQELCVYRVWRNLIVAYIFIFYERKQNKCVYVLFCDIIRIKEDCCWLNFIKTKFSV